MAILKQATAYTRLFFLKSSSDHVAGLEGASPAITLSKAGAAFGGAAGAVSEISSGWYKIALTVADAGTLGDLAFHITAANADPTDFVDQVSNDNAAGAGAITWTYTLTSTGGGPIADAKVWITTDNDPDGNVIASAQTDQNGVATFYLGAGQIYVWRAKSGFDFTNPEIWTVTA